MLGAIVGSPFEFDMNREKAHSKNFPLASRWSYVTDDSILTLAVADGIMKAIPVRGQAVSEEDFTKHVAASMRKIGRKYPTYTSWGNGSAMRVSPVAWAYVMNRYGYDLNRTLDEIRPDYYHVESCQETVPEAIIAFLEGKDFEDVR